MKVIIITVLLGVNILVTASAQEYVSVLNGKLTFSVPTGIIMETEANRLGTSFSYEEYAAFFRNKIGVAVSVFNEQSIVRGERRGFSDDFEELIEDRRLKKRDFLSLLAPGKFAFSRAGGSEKAEKTHTLIQYNGQTIGELFGTDDSVSDVAPTDSIAPTFYALRIAAVVDDNIIFITIKLHDEKRELPKLLPKYFYYENVRYKNYLWNDFIHLGNNPLYEKLLSDSYRELPEPFHRLRETFDQIVNTLNIPEYTASETYKTTTALRLRVDASVKSEAITTLPKDTVVKILNSGNYQIIDGIAARWLYVETEDGKRGWCFSGYLGP
jgi:hypothetical protein